MLKVMGSCLGGCRDKKITEDEGGGRIEGGSYM